MTEERKFLIIPVRERVCDFRNELLTDSENQTVASFVITDAGVICIKCWDSKVKYPNEFAIYNKYVKFELLFLKAKQMTLDVMFRRVQF